MVTPNNTQIQIATDASFNDKELDYTGSYTTTHIPAYNTLSKGIPLYTRMRHSTMEAGYTPWSATRQFSIAQYNHILMYVEQDPKTGVLYDSVISSNGNDIYICGHIRTYNPTTIDYPYVCKINKDGTVVWQKYFNTENSYFKRICIDTVNNHIYLIATVVPSGYTVTKISLIKMDFNGTVIWQKYFGNTNSTGLGDLCNGLCLSNNYLYICGYLVYEAGIATNKQYAFIMKVDLNGNIIHIKLINKLNIHFALFHQVIASSDGTYLYLSGYCYPNTSYYNGLVLKYNTTTNTIVWTKFISGAEYNYFGNFMSVNIAPNNNHIYVVGLRYVSSGSTKARAYLTKLDTAGNVLWEKQLSNLASDGITENDASDRLRGVVISGDNNEIYVSGYYYRDMGNGVKVLPIVAKFNSDGSLIWKKEISLPVNSYFHNASISPDNNIYVAGSLALGTYNKALIVGVGGTCPNNGPMLLLPDISWGDIPNSMDTVYSTISSPTLTLLDYDMSSGNVTLSDSNFTIIDLTGTVIKTYY